MKTLEISKTLPIPQNDYQEQYYIIVPGRLLPGSSEDEDPFTIPSPDMLNEEQLNFLEGSVLHSLVEPGTMMHLTLDVNGEDKSFPVLPLHLGDLEPRAVYDQDKQLLGTRLRLPGVHTNINRVYYHKTIGNPPKLDTLFLSYAGDMTRVIDDSVLRTRYAPGMSGLTQGGDSFLKPGQICFPKDLARDAIVKVANSFRLKAETEVDERKRNLYNEKYTNLMQRLQEHGCGILSGLKNLVCCRNPATVFGAVKRYELVVGSFPGAAIYITSKDIDSAGGDFDGDLVFVYDPDDYDASNFYTHCMRSPGVMVKKKEKIDKATNIAHKGNYSRSITLGSTTWLPEKETTILQEFKEKDIIGRAWYGLNHYNFLGAHYVPNNMSKDSVFNSRLELIIARAESHPHSDIAEELSKFFDAIGTKVTRTWTLDAQNSSSSTRVSVDFSSFTEEDYYHWYHICYVAIAHAFFPIYEIIFDLRKGEGRPPFNPNDAISGLMGYVDKVDWAGLEQGGVWIDFIKEIWESLPRTDTGGVDLVGAIVQFPAFYHLVNKRRLLTTSNRFKSTQNLAKYMGVEDFAGWLMDGLLLGK